MVTFRKGKKGSGSALPKLRSGRFGSLKKKQSSPNKATATQSKNAESKNNTEETNNEFAHYTAPANVIHEAPDEEYCTTCSPQLPGVRLGNVGKDAPRDDNDSSDNKKKDNDPVRRSSKASSAGKNTDPINATRTTTNNTQYEDNDNTTATSNDMSDEYGLYEYTNDIAYETPETTTNNANINTTTGACQQMAQQHLDPDQKIENCHKSFLEEMIGSVKDFRLACYQVATACVIREEEIGGMVDTIKSSNVRPKTKNRVVPRVPLMQNDMGCGKKVVIYV